MTGLEKILSEISDEAQAARTAALEEAGRQAEEIVQQAQRQADAECAKIRAQGQKACEDMAAQAQAGAELQRRRTLLAARQRLIRKALYAAGDAIINMPEKEYFESIVRIAALHAHPGQGTVYISARDHGRLPADFEEQLNRALPQGSSLTISPQPRTMYGGMVLDYGGVEENCSLRALFGARSENLLDLADEVMFGPRA